MITLAQYTGYKEEMQLHHLSPTQYLAAARKAVYKLRWFASEVNEAELVCHTPGSEYVAGDTVTIGVNGKNVLFISKPGNEYSNDELQGRRNAERYKHAIAQVIAQQEEADRNLHPMNREKYGALVPSKSYMATPLLVYANVLVFIAMVVAGISPMHPTAEQLLTWGSNFRPAIEQGEWWRMLTYMFLHGGAMHLLMNTYALLYIGMFLEPLMGKFRFVSAYVLTGVCAALMSLVMHKYSVGVGASGAIFGMYGVFFSVLTTTHIKKTLRKTMLRSILFFIVFNLMMGMQGNTDNAAHIGGLLSGIVIGYVYYFGIAKRRSFSWQLVTTAAFSAIVVALVGYVLHIG